MAAQCHALDLPAEAWGVVTDALETHEKVRLAATCRTLRAASAHWFRNDVVPLGLAGLCPPAQQVAWVCRVQAAVHLTLKLSDWHVVGSLEARGVRIEGLSLAVLRRSLPAALEGMTQLSTLSLASNSWPPLRLYGGWQHLPRQLQQLDLSNCGLSNVPRELTALTQLSKLCLSRNERIWCNSGWLLELKQLQQLELSSCRHDHVPGGLSRLTRLTDLRLDNNPIEDWRGLGLMDLLRRLDLQRCRLQQVPPELALLTRLRSLRLAGNPLKGGWQHLPAQLQQLHLQWCGLREVPAELATLTQLRELSLAQNPVTGGWQHLPAQLQQLHLQWCGLREVPAELATLMQLRELSLAQNPITGTRQRLPRLLSPVLSPRVWVPVSDFVHNPPSGGVRMLFLSYCFAIYAALMLFAHGPMLFWYSFSLFILLCLFMRASLLFWWCFAVFAFLIRLLVASTYGAPGAH